MPIVWPVMYPACFEQRKAHVAPNSAGSPSLPIGALAAIRLICSFGSAPEAAATWRVRSVRIASGARQLTVIPSGASSSDSVFASPVTAARKEFDSAMLGWGWRTAIDVMNQPHRAHQGQMKRHLPLVERRALKRSWRRSTRIDHQDVETRQLHDRGLD